jgi:tetratricopeptide (TPR) repeat protein
MTPHLIARHNAAIALRKAGRFGEALAEYEAIIAAGLTAPETLTMRAHLLGDVGRYDEAVVQYRAVIAARPDMIDAHETLAKLLPQIGRAGEALDAYRARSRRAVGLGARHGKGDGRP